MISPDNLATAFTVWAVVVALVGGLLVWALMRVMSKLDDMADGLARYMTEMEGRMTHVESTLNYIYPNFRPRRADV